MKTQKYAWKVVCDRSKDFVHSAMYSIAATGRARVIYQFDKWVQAPKWLREKGCHLFVFRTREAARNFLYERRSSQAEENTFYDAIYKCEISEIVLDYPIFYDLNFLADGTIVNGSGGFPYGSMEVKKLKLLSIKD
jgi:hypothetical protein